MKIIKITFVFAFGLFLATQSWAWVRFFGFFLISDGFQLDVIRGLFFSVFMFKTGFEGFVVMIIPSAILYYVARTELSNRVIILSYIYLSVVISILHVFYSSGFSPIGYDYAIKQGPIHILSAIIGALIFYGITQLFWKENREKVKEVVIDSDKRKYLINSTALLAGSAGLISSLSGPFQIWKKSDKYVDVNFKKLKEGQLMRVNVDGRPVWILKRSASVNNRLLEDASLLYDPNSLNSWQPKKMKNGLRSIRPEYFIAYGICTHLGCAPTYRPDGIPEFGGIYKANQPVFFCPCHGGVFDMAGRVYKGTPPPSNLKIPEYEFITEDIVRIYYPTIKEVWAT